MLSGIFADESLAKHPLLFFDKLIYDNLINVKIILLGLLAERIEIEPLLHKFDLSSLDIVRFYDSIKCKGVVV